MSAVGNFAHPSGGWPVVRVVPIALVLAFIGVAVAQPSPELFRRVLRREQAALDACLPSEPGPVRLRIRVGVLADGRVAAPAVEELEVPHGTTGVGVCVYRVLARLAFPAEPGGYEVSAILERRGGHLLLPPAQPLPPASS